ncbi:MAG: ABC transporter ATP-binding protein [Gammaproteobacteria bacterium]|nr:ABC transporter ATP-binding protein [Gammaproteobacteria bacterium]
MFESLKSRFGKKSAQPTATVNETNRIVLDDVTLRRGQNEVLRGISLELDENRIGVIGNNGSGKSSLIKLLNGLNLPDQGSVTVFGYDTREYRQKLPALVGFIFQNPDHQIIYPTVLEELAFGLEQFGQPTPQAQQNARAFLKNYQCEGLADKPVHTLSEGQKQLVCILAVLIMRPRLLLLDEPFSSLDLPTRKRLLNLLDSAAERLLMVSHDLAVLADFDKVIWLHEGRIRQQGRAEDVIAAYRHFSEQAAGLAPGWVEPS